MSIRDFLKIALLVGLVLHTTSCGHKKTVKRETIKVESKSTVTPLYFSGLIKPIRTIPVTNIQSDGVVIQKSFDYGKTVTKNQLLLIIVSEQLAKNYRSALTGYLKSKKSYTDAVMRMNEAEQLKNLKIMSMQEYQSTEAQLFNANLDLEQAITQLKDALQELGLPINKLPDLGSDAKKINLTLEQAPNTVKIYAPVTGIALLPDPSEGAKDTAATPLIIGSSVKSASRLLSIGDLSGISVAIKVSELNIDKILENEKAIITNEANPGMILIGKVSTVGRQSVSEVGSLPSFNVVIDVPNLKKEVLSKIRVGMTANVELDLKSPITIRVPVTAVINKGDNNFVKQVINDQIVETPVTTGATDAQNVQILQGLKPGDEVVTDATTD